VQQYIELVLVVDLGSKIVANITEVLDGVLDEHGDIGGHGEDDSGAEGGGLGEEGEVSKREVEVHGLLHVDVHGIVLVVGGGVVLQLDAALAQVTLATEADSLLVHTNLASITQDTEVTDNTLELGGGHLHVALVLRLGQAQVLRLDVHQLEAELGDAVLLRILEIHIQNIATILTLQGHHVVVATALQQLVQIGRVHTQSGVLITTVLIKSLGAKRKGTQRHMGGVHGLIKEKE
jgi:hypothetical protein